MKNQEQCTSRGFLELSLKILKMDYTKTAKKKGLLGQSKKIIAKQAKSCWNVLFCCCKKRQRVGRVAI